MTGLKFKSNGDGTCQLVVTENFTEEILEIPEKSPHGDKVISLFLPATFNRAVSFRLEELEEITVDPENTRYSSFDGVLFNKDMTTLIQCPPKKSGIFIVPSSVRKLVEIRSFYQVCSLDKVIFQEGIKFIGENTFYNMKIVTFPNSLEKISDEAFCWDWEPSWSTTIRAPKNSVAHRFAIKKGCRYMPTDCSITWNSKTWLEKFYADGADYHSLRREVWENTRAIVEDNDYTLPNGNSVLLTNAKRYSQFYYKPFNVSFERSSTSPEITVTADDCLDAAHKWVNDGLEVAVLNMASRRNPGGGVTSGAGAQEEYLFRCSDYYKFLYRYASYAEQYGLTRSHYQYPLDRNFGGIFSGGVTIFRENEATGYHLTEKPWKVNMIAVAGMNSPRLIFEGDEDRIAPELVEGVKNKIRTIFRIAIDCGQKNLVLGAIGCGAFHNPPKHVAELFREILCEHEFFGAFKKICFAVKTSHTSKGNTNFSAFKEILDGFIPTLKVDSAKSFEIPVKKIAVARDCYALLKTSGEVQIVDIHTGKSRYSRRFKGCVDIAGGFDHIVGLRKDGTFVLKSVGSQAPNHHGMSWFGGIAVDACEGHSAMLRRDGTVLCYDQYPSETLTKNYSQKVEAWKNIKQVALTFDNPYALTKDGKILRGDCELKDFQDATRGKIIQIAAFGCYYSLETVAALYANGTVKAWCDTDVEEVSSWHDVKKVCCGLHGAVIALTNGGKILSVPPPHKTKDGVEATELEDIIDIAVNFERLIALSKTGEIIYLKEGH